MTYSDAFQKFCRDTDIHGAKFLLHRSRQRSAVWLLLLLGSCGVLTYFFTVRIMYYMEHEVTTRVTVSTGHVFVPSVRICVTEPMVLDARKLTAHDIVNGRRIEHGKLPLNESLVFKEMNGKRYITEEAVGVFQDIVGTNSTDMAALEKYGEWIEVGKLRFIRGSPINWRTLLRTLIRHGTTRALPDRQEYNTAEVFRRAHYDYRAGLVCEMNTLGEDGVAVKDCSEGVRWKNVPTALGMCFVMDLTPRDAVIRISRLLLTRDTDSELFHDHSLDNHRRYFILTRILTKTSAPSSSTEGCSNEPFPG